MLTLCIFLNIVTVIRANMEGYIVGGGLAPSEKYPHAAFVVIKCNTTNDEAPHSWTCGSSILNQIMALTAAHCLYRCQVDQYTNIVVNVGNTHTKRGIARTIDDFIYHESFEPELNYADIAILKMSSPVELNSGVRRVAIMKNPPYAEPARLSGWGMINEKTHELTKDLKEVDQKLWPRADCLKTLVGNLPEGTFCANSKEKNGYGSWGDSGSGLVVRDYILIGLVSFKVSALVSDVVVYTDIGYYYDWITNTVDKLYCSNRKLG